VKIATWNVNSLTARLPRVLGWIEEQEPDILCMQETKQTDEAFPLGDFAALGYEGAHHGDGRWNGVAIVSRVGLEEPKAGFGSEEDENGTRILAATCGGIRVHSIYVPNGRSLDNEQYTIKLSWLARLKSYLAQTSDPAADVALCGDFNIAPSDADVWDPEQFVGATHVSAPERQALAELLGWGLEDTFARFHPEGGIFSWWDYRAGNFHKGEGMRIDLVLLTHSLAGRATGAWVDRNARKGSKPSDHAPVVVDFDPS
jgi:exodeoxyribonuclease-3